MLIAFLGNSFAIFALINALTFLLAGILVAVGYREFVRAEVSVNGSPVGKHVGLASSLHVTLGEFRHSAFLVLMVGFGCMVNLLGTALQPLLNLGLISSPRSGGEATERLLPPSTASPPWDSSSVHSLLRILSGGYPWPTC